MASEAHLRDCLGGFLRPGDAHTAEGAVPLLHEVLGLLPFLHGLRVRADAGFYSKDFVEDLDEKGIGYSVVAKMTAPVKRRVPSLRYHSVTSLFSVSEFRYRPTGWKKAHRLVVLRRKVPEEPNGELTLFSLNKYAYSVIVTNLPLTPYGVFTFYKDRAGLERIIRILKNNFPFGSAPTGHFSANAFYAEVSLLAYNLVIWFKRPCLPDDWQSYTLPTLRHRLLMIPGEFVKTDNVPTLKFPRNNLYQETFEYASKKINRLKPLV